MKASRIIAFAVIAVVISVAAYGLINGTIIQKEESHETEGAGQLAGEGQGKGYGAGQGVGSGGTAGLTIDTEHLLELEGEVVSENLSSSNYFTFSSGDKTYDVNVGARWYWDYKGIKLNPGDKVEVTGFDVQGRDNPTLAASTITNKDSGEQIRVREDDGTPAWREGKEDECEDSGIGGFSEQ